MNLVWNVKKKLDAQFSNENHLTLLLNKLSRSQILNPKQALGSCTLKTFYNDKSIAYQIRHTVLQYVWAMTFSKFTASRENVQYLLLPQNFYPLSNQKKKLRGLFQIQNCVNLVAWVHEAVQGRGIVFGGLAPVQVVFI